MLSRPLLSLTPLFALKYNANKQVANSAGFQFEELYDPTLFCCPNIVVFVIVIAVVVVVVVALFERSSLKQRIAACDWRQLTCCAGCFTLI